MEQPRVGRKPLPMLPCEVSVPLLTSSAAPPSSRRARPPSERTRPFSVSDASPFRAPPSLFVVLRFARRSSAGSVVSINLPTLTGGGTLPTAIGSLTSLTFLVLFYSFSGTLPTQLGNLISLTTLGLSVNSFSGRIPSEIGLLTNLNTLYLDGDSFTYGIPTELGRLTKLATLTLSTNSLSGTIPTSFAALTSVSTFLIYSNPCLYGTPLVSIGTVGTGYTTTSTNLGTATPASGCPYVTNANDLAAMQFLSTAWCARPIGPPKGRGCLHFVLACFGLVCVLRCSTRRRPCPPRSAPRSRGLLLFFGCCLVSIFWFSLESHDTSAAKPLLLTHVSLYVSPPPLSPAFAIITGIPTARLSSPPGLAAGTLASSPGRA